MKNNNVQYFCSIIIIGILFTVIISRFLFKLTPMLLCKLNLNDVSNIKSSQKLKSDVNIDYSKIYPIKNSATKNKQKSIIVKYVSLINNLKDKLEKNTSKYLYGYEKIVEFSYIYNKILGYDIVLNKDDAIVPVQDGYYTHTRSKVNMDECADELIEFNNYLKKLNIPYLYVYAPMKVSETQKLSSIYSDYTNSNADELLNKINTSIDYIDLRKNIKQNNLNHLELYYKVDHHWLPETGLWATNEISKYINQKYNMNLEIKNIKKNKYNYKVYPKMFLGTEGKYVSLANAQPEDFTLITPKYDTSFYIKIASENINKLGSYEETIIDHNQLKYKNFYKISQYTAYMYGDKPLIEIKNNKIKNNKKILLIKDSFAEVVSPFLALENEYLSIVDLRYFNGSLKSYISQYNPDIIIILYCGMTISDYLNENSQNHYLIERLNK